MKIYCNNRFNSMSDEEILRSVVGKDIWIKVHSKSNVNNNGELIWYSKYIKVFRISENRMYFLEISDDYIQHFSPRQPINIVYLRDRLNNPCGISIDRFFVIRPLEMYTSEEFFSLMGIDISELNALLGHDV